jgi:hypothetical protein
MSFPGAVTLVMFAFSGEVSFNSRETVRNFTYVVNIQILIITNILVFYIGRDSELMTSLDGNLYSLVSHPSVLQRL